MVYVEADGWNRLFFAEWKILKYIRFQWLLADSNLCISLCSSGMRSTAKYWYIYWTTQRNKKTWGTPKQKTHWFLPVEQWNPIPVLLDAWGLRQAAYLLSGIWEDFGFSEANPTLWGHFPISAYWNRWRLFCLSNIRNNYKGSWREEHCLFLVYRTPLYPGKCCLLCCPVPGKHSDQLCVGFGSSDTKEGICPPMAVCGLLLGDLNHLQLPAESYLFYSWKIRGSSSNAFSYGFVRALFFHSTMPFAAMLFFPYKKSTNLLALHHARHLICYLY